MDVAPQEELLRDRFEFYVEAMTGKAKSMKNCTGLVDDTVIKIASPLHNFVRNAV